MNDTGIKILKTTVESRATEQCFHYKDRYLTNSANQSVVDRTKGKKNIIELSAKTAALITTVQAMGIAALHACFLSVNPPYCTQITQEIHARNTRVKNTRKVLETDCKTLHCL